MKSERYQFVVRVLSFVCAVALIGCGNQDSESVVQLDSTSSGLHVREVRELYAGQHQLVGTVSVSDDGANLYVNYQLTDSTWLLQTTHLYVGATAPKKNAPGSFQFHHEGVFSETDAYEIPLSELGGAGTELFVAAHAEVRRIVGYEDLDYDAFDSSLPTSAPVSFLPVQGTSDAYWNITVSGGSSIDGSYEGWCIDAGRILPPGNVYTANVLSSLDPNLADYGVLEKPENIDLINYILNQDLVGQPSPSGGVYTYGDVQVAIWTLIDDEISTAGLGPWTQQHVDEIVDDAELNGSGYLPGCNDRVAVILVPVDPAGNIIGQVTIIVLTFPCEPTLGGEETAWAKGDYTFSRGRSRRSWGSYFTYVVTH